jgi:hypothetical protein
VSAFQLLGRAELEDMLYQPKNDRVLFTFFGISLTSRRRSKIANIRNVVNIKNRLFKILDEDGGGSRRFRKSVLIRDTNDEHYPYADKYLDFQTQPRWQENVAFAHDVQGIRVHVGRHYAYVDLEKKQWDYLRPLNLVRPQVNNINDAIRDRESRPANEDHIRDFGSIYRYGTRPRLSSMACYPIPRLTLSIRRGTPSTECRISLLSLEKMDHSRGTGSS